MIQIMMHYELTLVTMSVPKKNHGRPLDRISRCPAFLFLTGCGGAQIATFPVQTESCFVLVFYALEETLILVCII